MSNQRTVIAEQVSYRGTDGEDHVAYRGDKITVHADGVEHFDTFQASTPEGKWQAFLDANPPEKAPAKTVKPAEESGKKA